MKRLNLLPPDLARDQGTARLRSRAHLAIAALGVGCVVWLGIWWKQTSALDARIVAVTREIEARREAQRQADATIDRYNKLFRAATENERFRTTVPADAALALVAGLSNNSVWFDELTLARVAPKAAPAPSASAKVTTPPAPVEAPQLTVQLEGVAGSDAALVTFIRSLTQSPFLRDVHTEGPRTREAKREDGTGRTFALSMIMTEPQLSAGGPE